MYELSIEEIGDLSMNIKQIYTLTSFLFFLIIAGCDKTCKSTIQDFATVQNWTGKHLILQLCKGTYSGEVTAHIESFSSDQQVSLGTQTLSQNYGNYNSTRTCSLSDAIVELDIALAPSSFGLVKLCYDRVSTLIVIVNNYQSCPYGYLEQTSASTCGSN